MAMETVRRCDECGEVLENTTAFVEVTISENREPTAEEMRGMGYLHDGSSDEDVARRMDELRPTGGLPMVRAETRTLHFCSHEHFQAHVATAE